MCCRCYLTAVKSNRHSGSGVKSVHVISGFIMSTGHQIVALVNMVGKHFFKAQLYTSCSTSACKKGKGRDGGHIVDKAVLFLIYVLL